jgi:hypothetical protein
MIERDKHLRCDLFVETNNTHEVEPHRGELITLQDAPTEL